MKDYIVQEGTLISLGGPVDSWQLLLKSVDKM